MDILGDIDIQNDLFTNKLLITKKLVVDTFAYINKNLNINKDLLSTNIKTNGVLDVKGNIFVNDVLNTDSSFECINIDSENFNLYLNKKTKNYLFNNNVIVYNKTNIGDYVKLSNLFLYNNLFTKDYKCINANLNVINTIDADISNVETKYKINIDDNIDINGFLNLKGNINVKNNLNIEYFNIKFKENSSFIVGRNIKNYNEPYGLKTNLERGTLEVYLNGEWKAITELSTLDYKTKIIFNEYDSVDAHNIDFIQNNNLSIQFNNIEKQLNIYKDNINIYNNLNINDELKCNNNLNVKKNVICKNDLLINGLLKLPTDLDSNGMIRYNIEKEEIEFYKNNWEYVNMNNLDNGIVIDDNDSLDLYINKERKNGLILNNNINIIKNNLTIKSNVVCSSGIEVKNTMNVRNSIYFNNIGELKSNINSIIAYVTPNYNNLDINNNKFLNINDDIKDSYLLNNYESDYYYTTLYNNEFNNLVLLDIYYNKYAILNNYKKIFSTIYSTHDLVINKFEIHSIFKNDGNVYYNEGLLLKDIYLIIIYDEFYNIIFDNTNYNKKTIILKKNIKYGIAIQHKAYINILVDLYLKLKGYYYNDILFENDMSKFLYRIDNSFKAETNFEKDLDLKNDVDLEKTIISNNFMIKNLIIKSSINSNININKSSSNIFSIYNNVDNNIFSIKGNNIIIGNYNNKIDKNLNKIYVKTPFNKESLYIEGDTIIEKNINILYDLNIKNNCVIQNINSNNLYVKNNIIINNDINILNNLNIKNLILDNLNMYNKKEIKINKIENIENIILDNLKNNNIIINEKYINFNNKLYINYENNININSEESFNLFSIGNKINPNLSISSNGMIEIYTNKLILNNIDIIKELNLIKNKIIL